MAVTVRLSFDFKAVISIVAETEQSLGLKSEGDDPEPRSQLSRGSDGGPELSVSSVAVTV